jgi:hypothetical protein
MGARTTIATPLVSLVHSFNIPDDEKLLLLAFKCVQLLTSQPLIVGQNAPPVTRRTAQPR